MCDCLSGGQCGLIRAANSPLRNRRLAIVDGRFCNWRRASQKATSGRQHDRRRPHALVPAPNAHCTCTLDNAHAKISPLHRAPSFISTLAHAFSRPRQRLAQKVPFSDSKFKANKIHTKGSTVTFFYSNFEVGEKIFLCRADRNFNKLYSDNLRAA